MFILDWLKDGVSWVLVQVHAFLSWIGMDPNSGWTWAFSIVGLVVIIRILLSFSLEVEMDGVWPWARWRVRRADPPS